MNHPCACSKMKIRDTAPIQSGLRRTFRVHPVSVNVDIDISVNNFFYRTIADLLDFDKTWTTSTRLVACRQPSRGHIQSWWPGCRATHGRTRTRLQWETLLDSCVGISRALDLQALCSSNGPNSHRRDPRLTWQLSYSQSQYKCRRSVSFPLVPRLSGNVQTSSRRFQSLVVHVPTEVDVDSQNLTLSFLTFFLMRCLLIPHTPLRNHSGKIYSFQQR